MQGLLPSTPHVDDGDDLPTSTRGRNKALTRRRSSFSVADIHECIHQSTAVIMASAQIGEGASGVAFSVSNPVDKKRYVLKRVKLTGEVNTEALKNEVRIHSCIKHKNIVGYQYSWMEGDVTTPPGGGGRGSGGAGPALCILLERCAGELWSCLVNDDGMQPTYEERVHLTKQILSGLAAIHEQGIVHRDLSLWNIFLSDGGDVRIGDFGLAVKLPSDGILGGLTETGACQLDESALGSIFSAPELGRQGHDGGYGSAVDIYSAGLVILSIWHGIPLPPLQTPLSAYSPSNSNTTTTSSYSDIMANALVEAVEKARASPSPVLHLASDAPPGLASLIRQMIDPNPSLRPTAIMLEAAIEGALASPDHSLPSSPLVSSNTSLGLLGGSSRRSLMMMGLKKNGGAPSPSCERRPTLSTKAGGLSEIPETGGEKKKPLSNIAKQQQEGSSTIGSSSTLGGKGRKSSPSCVIS